MTAALQEGIATTLRGLISGNAAVNQSVLGVRRLGSTDVLPSLLLNFAGNKGIDSRITVVRASTATFFGADGIMRTAVANVLRRDHDPVTGVCKGALIEESRTNLLLWSEQFDKWITTAMTITANATTAPDGTLTADKLVEDTATGVHQLGFNCPTNYVSGTAYTTSYFVKPAGRTKVRISYRANWFPDTNHTDFDLSAKTVTPSSGCSGTIVDVGDGWLRISGTATADATGSSASDGYLNFINDSGDASYTGDGTSGIHTWGAQLEAGAFPTSYIKTEASQVTRAADAVSMTGANFSSFYNQSEGTFVLTATQQAVTKGQHNGIFMGNANPLFYTLNGASTLRSYDGTNVVSGGAIISDVVFTASLGYSASGMAQSLNGAAVNTANFDGSFGSSTMHIGSTSTGGNSIQGYIASLAYYPKRLTNTELQALSSQ